MSIFCKAKSPRILANNRGGGVSNSFAKSFIGCLLWFTGSESKIPDNMMKCDGRLLLRADYPDLFEVIGTTYGFTDATNFRIPNMVEGSNGLFIRSVDPNGTLGTISGSNTNTHNHVHNNQADVQPGFLFHLGIGVPNSPQLAVHPHTHASSNEPTQIPTVPRNIRFYPVIVVSL